MPVSTITVPYSSGSNRFIISDRSARLNDIPLRHELECVQYLGMGRRHQMLPQGSLNPSPCAHKLPLRSHASSVALIRLTWPHTSLIFAAKLHTANGLLFPSKLRPSSGVGWRNGTTSSSHLRFHLHDQVLHQQSTVNSSHFELTTSIDSAWLNARENCVLLIDAQELL